MSKNLRVPTLRFKEFSGEWEEKELKDVTTYVDYRGRAPIKTEKGNFLVTAKNIKKGFIDYECSKEYVSEDNYLNVMSKGLPEIGDVLFTTEAPMGNVAQVDIKDIALAQRVIKFRSKQILLNNYLFHYMLSAIFQSLIFKKSIGTTVQGISGKELHKIKVSFPSILEQEKIASFLSSIDKKIEQLSKKDELLESYKKGVMQKIFSQEIRFQDDDGSDYFDWEEKKLGELPIIISDGNYGEMYPTSKDFKSNGVAFLRANNIKNLKIDDSDTKYITKEQHSILTSGHLQTNDILITTRGDLGNIALVDYKHNGSNINAQICLLRVSDTSKLNYLYLLFVLDYRDSKIQYKAFETGTALKQLPKGNLRKLILKLPCLEEQTKIANFLSSIDTKISQNRKALEETKKFKKALLQQMFV